MSIWNHLYWNYYLNWIGIVGALMGIVTGAIIGRRERVGSGGGALFGMVGGCFGGNAGGILLGPAGAFLGGVVGAILALASARTDELKLPPTDKKVPSQDEQQDGDQGDANRGVR